MKKDGDTSRMFSKTVSVLSAKLTTDFAASGTNVDSKRSSTWQSGRKQSCSSPSCTGSMVRPDCTEKTMFSCEIIAPFGCPVVPEV